MGGFTDIHVDDYGWLAQLVVTQDGTAVDISAYTTCQFVFRKPDGTTVTKTATFDDDGTDGVLNYTVESGLIDVPGRWRVWAVIAKTGAELTSDPVRFDALVEGSG